MRAHTIENGKIVNTIEVESLDTLPGCTLIDADEHGGSIGDLWDGTAITKPAPTQPPIPRTVTMRQARLALLGVGMLPAVETAINALPEPQKSAARIEWDYSSEVRRDQPLVMMLAPALGLTAAQIDNLFLQASTL